MVRQTGAPLVFTEYYSQDCRANLALVQETVPVTVLQVSPMSTVNIQPPLTLTQSIQ